jgi:p-aminobenzoyl-glutamate transporter AbgT
MNSGMVNTGIKSYIRYTSNHIVEFIMKIKVSLGLGTLIGVLLSWSVNKSVLWAIIHGFFGWFYVIYHIIFRM